MLKTWERPSTSPFFALICLPTAAVSTKWLHSGLIELGGMITQGLFTGQGSLHSQRFTAVVVMLITKMQTVSLPEPKGPTPLSEVCGSGRLLDTDVRLSLSSVCIFQCTSETPPHNIHCAHTLTHSDTHTLTGPAGINSYFSLRPFKMSPPIGSLP